MEVHRRKPRANKGLHKRGLIVASLAKLIADEINDQTSWSLAFDARRRTFPLQDATLLNTVTVSVFDGPRTATRETRASWDYTRVVFVAIQKKLAADDAESTYEIDELTALLEEIEAHFEGLDETSLFDGMEFIDYDEGTERLPFDPALLQDVSQYAAVIGLQFR